MIIKLIDTVDHKGLNIKMVSAGHIIVETDNDLTHLETWIITKYDCTYAEYKASLNHSIKTLYPFMATRGVEYA